MKRLLPIQGEFRWGYLYGVPTFYSNFHLGVDFVCPKGTPVIAPEAGEIVFVGNGKEGGKTIHLLGVSGTLTRYLHLNAILVVKGEKILPGKRIGTVGNTGALSKGDHLHFDCWITGKLDLTYRKGLVNPIEWLTEEDDMTLDRETAKTLIKRLYGYNGTGLLRRVTDPEIEDKVAFNSRVERLLGSADWAADVAAQADEIARSEEFISVRVKIT